MVVFTIGDVKEDFIGYTNITGDTTGQHIAESILARIEAIDLNPLNMRAQSYDGTGDFFLLDDYNYIGK